MIRVEKRRNREREKEGNENPSTAFWETEKGVNEEATDPLSVE